ncbi:FecR domain-containing protein [Granulosicoccaceae sp. 1_MG-2023]|nr:FecR domain-containing protein [Granulosicoccaceae sp. 1_MG-2023]
MSLSQFAALFAVSACSRMRRVLVCLLVSGLLVQSAAAAPLLRSDRVIQIRPGETLSQVVERELGSSAYWPAVAEHNGILDPTRLKAGQSLRIPVPYTRSPETAVVLFVKGDVQRKPARARTPVRLTRGEQVRVGDELLTGRNGFASVEFSSGSVINVQPGSHILIVDVECTEQAETCVIELYSEKGDVQSRVKSRDGQPTFFRIDTPTGSAAVRGTVFDVSAGADRAAAGVTEGVIDVTAAGQSVPVETGFGVITEKGQAPGTPQALLPAPLIRQPGPRLAVGDELRWWPVPLAESYEVTLSQDQAGLQTVHAAKVTAATYTPADVPAGQYFVRVRALDIHGLKGAVAVAPVVVAGVRSQAPVPGLSAGRDQDLAIFTLSQGVNGARSYELQIATDETFTEVFPVEVQPGEGAQYTIPPDGAVWARVRAVFPDRRVSPYSQSYRISR